MKVCDYVCDFFVKYTDGREELIEVKGYATPEFRLKRKLFAAAFLQYHPDIRYVVV